MWNDTDIPLAYLITFRCYGTWLHGDERGSVDRYHNIYDTPPLPPDKRKEKFNRQHMKHLAVELNAKQRQAVDQAVRETCLLRDWVLLALNVRTNHVHLIVSIGTIKPETALNVCKANATRQMREQGCWQHEHSPWSAKAANDICGTKVASNAP